MSDDFLNDLFDLDGGDNLVHVDRTVYQRAPFPMPGAKWRSLHEIIPRLPIRKSSVWVESYGGTGVVSWNVPECKVMVFNDRYSGVVAFYRALKERKEELVDYLMSMPPHSREEWIHSRQTWVDETDDVIRAAKWYYMTELSVLGKRAAFGRGLQTRFLPLPDRIKLFDSIHYILQNFYLENLDARVCIKDYDSINAIHYWDPPYVGTDQGTYKHKWTWDDMLDLKRLIPQLEGFIALSHYPDSRIDDWGCWDAKYQWDVKVTAEPMVFMAENQKEGKQDVTELNNATECLWIREAKHG